MTYLQLREPLEELKAPEAGPAFPERRLKTDCKTQHSAATVWQGHTEIVELLLDVPGIKLSLRDRAWPPAPRENLHD